MRLKTVGKLVVLVSLLGAGCATSSLQRKMPVDVAVPTDMQSSVLALRDVADGVSCDDEAIYLRDHLVKRGAFIGVELPPTEWRDDELGVDAVLSGRITGGAPVRRSFGFGKFLAIITVGGYYFMGGPTAVLESSTTYSFTLKHANTGKTQQYNFEDRRKAYTGLYGPSIPMRDKRDVYQNGWEALRRRMATDWPSNTKE